jgi:polyphosphate kinase 2 (PPK2 family)
MPDKDIRAERAAVRELLTARLRGGRVNLAAMFLHISASEQRDRLLARLKEPDKQRKFSGNDIPERRLWNDYRKAYAAAIGRCSTRAAWYVVPANRKWYPNWAVSQVLIETMEEMKLLYPKPQLDVRALKKSLKAAA